jgi:hypothetical protein
LANPFSSLRKGPAGRRGVVENGALKGFRLNRATFFSFCT